MPRRDPITRRQVIPVEPVPKGELAVVELIPISRVRNVPSDPEALPRPLRETRTKAVEWCTRQASNSVVRPEEPQQCIAALLHHFVEERRELVESRTEVTIKPENIAP